MRALHRGKSCQAGCGYFGDADRTGLIIGHRLTKCTPSVAMTLILTQQGTVKLHAAILPQLQAAKIIEHGRFPPAKNLEALLGQGFIAIGYIKNASNGTIR